MVSNLTAGNSLKRVDEFSELYFGRIADKKMNVIIFPVKLYEFSFKVFTNVRKDRLHKVEDFFSKNVSSVFGDENQMNMNIKDTMSTMTDIGIISHGLIPNSLIIFRQNSIIILIDQLI